MSKEKFKGKYRSDTSRLKNWDYTWDAAYFITICTKNREHYFGEIENGKMKLSKIGVLADVFWYEIKNHTKNVELDAFVVMPNHVHGILIINNCLKTNIENNNHCMVVANNCGGVANHCRVVACNDPTMVGNAPTIVGNDHTMVVVFNICFQTIIDNQYAVHMVWHYHKCIQFNVFGVVFNFIPKYISQNTDF